MDVGTRDEIGGLFRALSREFESRTGQGYGYNVLFPQARKVCDEIADRLGDGESSEVVQELCVDAFSGQFQRDERVIDSSESLRELMSLFRRLSAVIAEEGSAITMMADSLSDFFSRKADEVAQAASG